MEKKELDQLYHLLRRSSNLVDGHTKGPGLKTTLTPGEQVSVIYGLCRHLLAGGDYSALIRFSMLYGECFLVNPVYEAIRSRGWKPERIVEFGAGLGWLGRGLAAKFGMLPTLLVDKRPWPLIDLVLDLEFDVDKADMFNRMKVGDVIVSSELLHCLDDPYEVMADFAKWPTAVLEYIPEDDDFRDSYSTQTVRYGAGPAFRIDSLRDVFKGREITTVDLDPFFLMLIEPCK